MGEPPHAVLGRGNPLRGGTECCRDPALLDHAVGEAHAYVQGASLKACAVFLVRLSNSPITRARKLMSESIVGQTLKGRDKTIAVEKDALTISYSAAYHGFKGDK